MTWDWMKYSALCVIALFVVWLVTVGIYDAGYARAEAEGRAALESLKRDHSDKAAREWAAYVAQLEQVHKNARQAQVRADALESDLLKTKTALAIERQGFAKRIADATSNADCRLGPDVVRLYNEALYGPGHAPLGGGENGLAGTSSTVDFAFRSAPAGTGVLRQQAVTMRDLLAHAKLYGEWAREVHAIAQGWITLNQDR